jgi:ornithine cyclodeaminase
MDKLIVDDWEQYRTVGEIWYQPLPESPHGETGEIVAGLKPGREAPEERIVAFNKGIAVHDILMGSALLERAAAKGLGTELEFLDPSHDLPLIDV